MLNMLASSSARQTDILSILQHAHWIVLTVMLLLAVMFLVSVYIMIYKSLYFSQANKQSSAFLEAFWKSRDIEQIYQRAQGLARSPISQMFTAGYTELAKITADDRLRDDREGNLENIHRSLRRSQTAATTRLESMVPFLATTGSAAPFIGLFGTVVGIMFSFQEIGNSGSATLQTVGPHIAEALLATAIGLVAAIPAVMAFNFFARRIKVMRAEMETFEQDYLNIIKRHFLG